MVYKSWKPKGDNYISPKGIAFPIGMVIITATNINPTNWTYGTWQLFGQGKCLVGVDTNDSDFNTPLKTGGSKTHYHTTGDHKLTINEIPAHSHNINFDQVWSWGGTTSIATTSGGPYGGSGYVANTGGDKAHNHGNTGNTSSLQPYITVYFWRRIS